MQSIGQWLERLELGEYADVFVRNRVDLEVAKDLTDADLRELGVKALGHRKKLLRAIADLERGAAPAMQTKPAASGANAPDAERRHLTVLFCDLVGSTALSEALDAEDLRELMRAYMRAAGSVIDRYGGHVAQYLGDGLMCYFGWPTAHEDDAQRAVRSALEIVEAVKSVAAPEPLRVRVGIASGQVVIGETGGGEASLPSLAVGETPNLAARMQGLAGPDEIVIAATTRRLVGAAFELDDLGEHAIKGFTAPVHSWKVTGVVAAQGRFEAAHGSRLTAFVGRESELALVKQRWDLAKKGNGQVVLLCGEPGIGKSHLCQVFREQVSGDAHTLLRYQCSPYHMNTALYPLIEQLKSSMEFDRADDVQAKIDKLEELLRTAFADISTVAPLFAALLSLDGNGRYPVLNLDPKARKEAMLNAYAGLITAFASHRPVLMVFEDAHWSDPTTREALNRIVSATTGQCVLALITFRPEFRPSWTDDTNVSRLELQRFGPDTATQIVEKIAGNKTLPNEVLNQIIDRTDGVPLFVEELTKTVLESGLLTEGKTAYRLTGPLPDLAIPATLHDSLMSRLDRLASERELAQIGACIGRQFSRELLAAVSGLAESELDSALDKLVDAELIFLTGTARDTSYMFKHALVQDAAHSSLLKSNRAAIHARIADILEARFTEIAESAPETLAHHYTEGAMFDKAVGYWRMAAERASASFANSESIGHYEKGLATLARLPDGNNRVESELPLRLGLIASLRMADRYEDALAELDRAESLATDNNRIAELGRIHHLRGNIYFPLGKYERCLAEHQASAQFARQSGSTEDEARALGGIGDAHYMAGRMSSAHEHFDRCVALCREHSLERIELAYLPMRASSFMYRVLFDNALEDSLAVIEMAERSGHPRGEIIARNISSWTYLERHDFKRAQRHAEIALRIVEKIGARRFIPLFNDIIARVRLHAGDHVGALALLEDSLAVSRQTGITFLGPFVLGAIALASDNGAHRREALQEGVAVLDRGCVAHNYFWFYRDAIEVGLADRDWDSVEAYAAALETYFRAEPLPWAEFIVARGRALAQSGRGAVGAALPQLRRLRDQALHLRMMAELPRLEAAFAKATAS